MSFDRKKGVKLAGVVLSGTLVLAGASPVAAEQKPENTQETVEHQNEEKTEKVVFLDTTEASGKKEQGPYDDQAVHSLEEALALLETEEEQGPVKFELIKEEEKILVLCNGTQLSEDESKLLEEKEIILTTDTAYEEAQKAKLKTEEKKEADEEVKPVTAAPETQGSADETGSVPFIWEASKVTISSPAEAEKTDESKQEPDDSVIPAEDSKTETAKEENSAETTGILLPGFSLPSGVILEDETERGAGDEIQDKVSEEDTPESEDGEAVKEETAADLTDEETETEEDLTVIEPPVYNLFAVFGVEESVQTADAEETNPLVETEEVTAPPVLALPGSDLVGSGTSGVGQSSSSSSSQTSKPQSSTSGTSSGTTSSTGSSSSGSTSSGNTSSGNTSTGSSSSGSTASTGTASGAATQTSGSSGKKIIQTSDSSNRNLWGLTAGLSGAMAAFFTAQWRKLRRE